MPTPQQHACNLAAALVQSQYGDLASELIAVLLNKGRSSLPEIIRAANMPAALVKQLLLMLIQQNCVQAYLQPAEQFVTGLRPAMYLYEPCLDRILQSVRGPRFLVFIKDHFGQRGYMAEETVKLLLEHGRLRLDQIIPALLQTCTTRYNTEVAAATSGARDSRSPSPGLGPAPDAEALQRVFVELVQERFVERAPPCTLPPPEVAPKMAPGRKSRAPKAGSAEYAKQQSAQLRMLGVKAYEEERFKLPLDVILGTVGEQAAAEQAAAEAEQDDVQQIETEATAAAASKSRKRKKASSALAAQAAPAAAGGAAAGAAGAAAGDGTGGISAATAKKRRILLDDEDGAPAGGAQPEAAAAAQAEENKEPAPILWRVNTEEFNRQFRHAACVSLVQSKLGQDAGTVLAAMLAHSGRYEQSLQADMSISMTAAEVQSAYNRGVISGQLKLLGPQYTLQQVLEHLAADSMEPVTAVTGPSTDSYVVNLLGIMERVRLQQVQATIRDRFADTGLRIFHLLLYKGQFEQKHIADYAMQPQKETRQVLYQMFRAGFLGLQDIPRTSDRAPSRSFYTWRVELATVYQNMAAVLYKAMYNVHLRLQHEMAQHTYLVNMLEAAHAAGAMNFNLTSDDEATLHRLQKVDKQLKASMHSLDEMAAMFNEY